jgi:hypothetical protein
LDVGWADYIEKADESGRRKSIGSAKYDPPSADNVGKQKVMVMANS